MDSKIKGIVLKSIDAKENDVILTVYLENIGKVGLYARGIKKMSSKNAYACQLFDKSEFMFDNGTPSGLKLLKSAALIESYPNIKKDFERLALASIALEIINQIEENDMYDTLVKVLELIEKDDEPYTALDIFIVEVLRKIGIEPVVDGCAICGGLDKIETISIDDGGFICSNCNEMHLKSMDVEMLKNFRIVNKANYQVYDKIKGLKINNFALTKLLLDFFMSHSGVSLRSIKALENINELS